MAAAMASEAAVSLSGILAAGQGQVKAKAVFSYTPGSSFVRERGYIDVRILDNTDLFSLNKQYIIQGADR